MEEIRNQEEAGDLCGQYEDVGNLMTILAGEPPKTYPKYFGKSIAKLIIVDDWPGWANHYASEMERFILANNHEKGTYCMAQCLYAISEDDSLK